MRFWKCISGQPTSSIGLSSFKDFSEFLGPRITIDIIEASHEKIDLRSWKESWPSHWNRWFAYFRRMDSNTPWLMRNDCSIVWSPTISLVSQPCSTYVFTLPFANGPPHQGRFSFGRGSQLLSVAVYSSGQIKNNLANLEKNTCGSSLKH